jgi:hypothetical protein
MKCPPLIYIYSGIIIFLLIFINFSMIFKIYFDHVAKYNIKNLVAKLSRWWPSGKSLKPRGLLPLWSQVRPLWLFIWWLLKVYMVVTFRARGISRGARKLDPDTHIKLKKKNWLQNQKNNFPVFYRVPSHLNSRSKNSMVAINSLVSNFVLNLREKKVIEYRCIMTSFHLFEKLSSNVQR